MARVVRSNGMDFYRSNQAYRKEAKKSADALDKAIKLAKKSGLTYGEWVRRKEEGLSG